ncbi:hypothetical protein TRV_06154 [Trichophyton verrucosum HKI 0517]|uniref:Uncharacterized protein n=1 Tax=Trichophyton verrucosum (strain HKI 0517) TaxID=663202 RepID=D4DG52_TRIVH|nr:uncharacterized protein TRV_06154 [Trichophyton verrucosum HKI 0517]EFE39153.1 hypothetical protein TRV_06154 [Trichophyton verrucosum HKI 0517]
MAMKSGEKITARRAESVDLDVDVDGDDDVDVVVVVVRCC